MPEILEDIFLLWTVCSGLINSTSIPIAVFFMCGTRTWIDWYHELTAPGRYLIVEMTASATSKLSNRYHVSPEGSSSSPRDWKESLAFCRVEKLVPNGSQMKEFEWRAWPDGFSRSIHMCWGVLEHHQMPSHCPCQWLSHLCGEWFSCNHNHQDFLMIGEFLKPYLL